LTDTAIKIQREPVHLENLTEINMETQSRRLLGPMEHEVETHQLTQPWIGNTQTLLWTLEEEGVCPHQEVTEGEEAILPMDEVVTVHQGGVMGLPEAAGMAPQEEVMVDLIEEEWMMAWEEVEVDLHLCMGLLEMALAMITEIPLLQDRMVVCHLLQDNLVLVMPATHIRILHHPLDSMQLTTPM
jgi:hypothetical protein